MVISSLILWSHEGKIAYSCFTLIWILHLTVKCLLLPLCPIPTMVSLIRHRNMDHLSWPESLSISSFIHHEVTILLLYTSPQQAATITMHFLLVRKTSSIPKHCTANDLNPNMSRLSFSWRKSNLAQLVACVAGLQCEHLSITHWFKAININLDLNFDP